MPWLERSFTIRGGLRTDRPTFTEFGQHGLTTSSTNGSKDPTKVRGRTGQTSHLVSYNECREGSGLNQFVFYGLGEGFWDEGFWNFDGLGAGGCGA